MVTTDNIPLALNSVLCNYVIWQQHGKCNILADYSRRELEMVKKRQEEWKEDRNGWH